MALVSPDKLVFLLLYESSVREAASIGKGLGRHIAIMEGREGAATLDTENRVRRTMGDALSPLVSKLKWQIGKEDIPSDIIDQICEAYKQGVVQGKKEYMLERLAL